MHHLFAYGSLMCDDIMHHVSGLRLNGMPGRLTGFRRYALKGEEYPAIVAAENGHVEGVVYLDVPDAAWMRLDRFEGEMYDRRIVSVTSDTQRALRAETYVLRPDYLGLVEAVEWRYADFLRHGKDRFLKQYKGYRAL